MLSPQQVGVALGDASASEQAESDHKTSLLTATVFAGKSNAGQPGGPIQTGGVILTEAVVNQGTRALFAIC
jgi:hypothetical protein